MAGILALVGISILFVTAVFLGLPQSTTEALLRYYARGQLFIQAAMLAFGLSDFFFIPAVLALYFVLKGVNKTAMLIATALFGAFLASDLGVNIVNYSAVAVLGGKFVAATSDVQRAAYVAAADLANATIAANWIAHGMSLAVANIILGSVMLRGIFDKGTAYLGIGVGAIGLVASPLTALFSPGVPFVIFAVLNSVWFVLLGSKLFKLGYALNSADI